VPTQFVRLLRLAPEVRSRYDLGSLRLVIHGSAPVAPDVKRAMIEWLGPILYEFYGGTEGGGTAIDSATWLAHPGSVGRPIPGYDMTILAEDGTPAPVGTPGQVYFRGVTRFAYKGDPDKTAEAHRGEWHTLGDIGYVDGEGFLYLCDRRADVIVSGGVNIYPAQIEGQLLSHPAVADCCVIGIPDDEWGETVHAVVQPAPDVDASPALANEIMRQLRTRLAGYQVPRSLEFRSALPRTETGKLARHQIRSPYWQGRQRRI
jgi:long-chain acyl-CoA synthetase